jgi:hypothetical protein
VFIKVEPTDLFMYRVTLIYDLEDPGSEDQRVRDYLAENGLAPKHQGAAEHEGRRCETMVFGGCYLGRHLEFIAETYRHALEVRLLTAEVERHLDSGMLENRGFHEGRRQEAIAELVRVLHRESSFQTNGAGELMAVLDAHAVRKAATRIDAG